MAQIDPNEPQVRDPELQADLIRQLSIVGPLGVLRVADIVIPTISMGNVVQQTVQIRTPVFASTDVFTAGVQTAAPANTTHANTGPLIGGNYDIQLYISPHISESHVWRVEHIDAAMVSVSAVWEWLVPASGPPMYQTLAYAFTLNESLRIRNTTLFGVGIESIAAIFAVRRV